MDPYTTKEATSLRCKGADEEKPVGPSTTSPATVRPERGHTARTHHPKTYKVGGKCE
jgi:hypothetical protein